MIKFKAKDLQQIDQVLVLTGNDGEEQLTFMSCWGGDCGIAPLLIVSISCGTGLTIVHNTKATRKGKGLTPQVMLETIRGVVTKWARSNDPAPTPDEDKKLTKQLDKLTQRIQDAWSL